MAGDWLKMDADLPEKPEVWRIAGIIGVDADLVVGKLLKVWRWFDKHTIDGNARGVTLALLDSVTGVNGFGEAMKTAGWVISDASGISLPNFDRKNGKTAKERALTAKRVAKSKVKSNGDSVSDALPVALPREEKRREDIKAITRDAVAAYNATMVSLPKVGSVGMDNREKHTKRCLKVAREISLQQYGSNQISRQFWDDYFAVCQKDKWASGRDSGYAANPDYKPDFEVLTRPEKMLQFFERATQ